MWPLFPQFNLFLDKTKYRCVNKDQWFNILVSETDRQRQTDRHVASSAANGHSSPSSTSSTKKNKYRCVNKDQWFNILVRRREGKGQTERDGETDTDKDQWFNILVR